MYNLNQKWNRDHTKRGRLIHFLTTKALYQERKHLFANKCTMPGEEKEESKSSSMARCQLCDLVLVIMRAACHL